MLYMVWFADSDIEMFFATFQEAEHYARLNAGNVLDVDKWETVVRFV